jgi:DNA-directed RNA polymerase specialized sigma24 family protein
VSDATKLATAAANRDPATGLRAVAALRKLLEQLESAQVSSARQQGWSWQDIADVLGVSRQAVHKKPADHTRHRRRIIAGRAGRED